MPGALTSRQAKAAHKARGGQAVSDQDIRKLQREIQLDRRAWAVKEREKGRNAAAHKRAEDQQRTKAEEAASRLGTQRRFDRFGYKSSQFHLGTFFTKASDLPQSISKASSDRDIEMSVEAEAEDDGLDDEALLSVLQDVDVQLNQASSRSREDPPTAHDSNLTTTSLDEGERIDWDDFLESGTQIEREFDAEAIPIDTIADVNQQSQRGSFDSSSSLGLTTQDIEALDPTPAAGCVQRTANDLDIDRRLMPPPPVLPRKHLQPQTNDRSGSSLSESRAEFTLTQLENFVDDDLSPSQI